MRLTESTLAFAILTHLNRSGSIPRKNLFTPFSSSVTYRHYADTVKRLLDEKYIELFRYKRLNHIRITKLGLTTLVKSQDHDKSLYNETAKPTNTKEKKRLSLVTDVIGLCVASQITTDKNDKPPLIDFFECNDPKQSQSEANQSEANQSEANQSEANRSGANQGEANQSEANRSEDIKEHFEDLLKDGVFYSSDEIRKAYIKIKGKNEIANWSRFIGVIFKNKNLVFVYSVGKELIKWLHGSEDRTVKFILNFFSQSPIITSCITLHKIPTCIVCGRGYTLIPKLIYGRKWGRNSESKKTEVFRTRLARDHINAHNLGKVFCAAYYVTIDKKGTSDLILACTLSEATKNIICDKWFSELPTATRIRTYRFHQGLNREHKRIIFMPYIDLIELDFYKKQGEACHFVIPKGTQEAVSRVMGPLLISARDLSGNMLTYNTYDSMGAKIE